jgi:release factor glutamine methyltransferase
MTIDAALKYGEAILNESDVVDTTSYTAQRLLLQHVLNVGQAHLFAHGDSRLTNEQQVQYKACLQQAAQGKPIPYIIGRIPFRYIELAVTPAVLIPRPETEQLVEQVVAWAKGRDQLQIIDVGTGSGCIAISLALELPQAHVTAIDISADALAVAQQNAKDNHAGNIRFLHGSLLDPLSEPIDIIAANLPYIRDDEWTQLAPGVKLYEPELALRGGEDGLDIIRDLLAQAAHKLRSGGAIFLEIGWQQGSAATELARRFFPHADINCKRDYAGHDRIVAITNIDAQG